MVKKKSKAQCPKPPTKNPVAEVSDDPKYPRFTGAGVSLMFLALGFSTLWSTDDNEALKVLMKDYFNFFSVQCAEWREKDANIYAKSNKGNPQRCQCFADLGVQPHQPWCLNFAIPESHPGLAGSTKAPDALFEQGYNQPPMLPSEHYDYRAEQCRFIGRGLQPVYGEDLVTKANACLKEHKGLLGSTCRVKPKPATPDSVSSSMENAALGYGVTTNLSKYVTVINRCNAGINLTPEEMRHIDVGCGSQPNVPLMVLFECGCLLSDGIEFDPIRAYSAQSMLVWFIRQLQSHARTALRKLAEIVEQRVHIYLADLDFCTPAFWNQYTHVFSYDFVFHDDLMTKLVRKVHNSESILFVTTFARQSTSNVNPASYTYYNSICNPRPAYDWTEYVQKAEGYYGHKLVNGVVYKWAPSPPGQPALMRDDYRTSPDVPEDVAYVKQLEEEGIREDPVRQANGIITMSELHVSNKGTDVEFTINNKWPKLLLHLGNCTRRAEGLLLPEEGLHANTFLARDQQQMNAGAVEGGGAASKAAYTPLKAASTKKAALSKRRTPLPLSKKASSSSAKKAAPKAAPKAASKATADLSNTGKLPVGGNDEEARLIM